MTTPKKPEQQAQTTDDEYEYEWEYEYEDEGADSENKVELRQGRGQRQDGARHRVYMSFVKAGDEQAAKGIDKFDLAQQAGALSVSDLNRLEHLTERKRGVTQDTPQAVKDFFDTLTPENLARAQKLVSEFSKDKELSAAKDATEYAARAAKLAETYQGPDRDIITKFAAVNGDLKDWQRRDSAAEFVKGLNSAKLTQLKAPARDDLINLCKEGGWRPLALIAKRSNFSVNTPVKDLDTSNFHIVPVVDGTPFVSVHKQRIGKSLATLDQSSQLVIRGHGNPKSFVGMNGEGVGDFLLGYKKELAKVTDISVVSCNALSRDRKADPKAYLKEDHESWAKDLHRELGDGGLKVTLAARNGFVSTELRGGAKKTRLEGGIAEHKAQNSKGRFGWDKKGNQTLEYVKYTPKVPDVSSPSIDLDALAKVFAKAAEQKTDAPKPQQSSVAIGKQAPAVKAGKSVVDKRKELETLKKLNQEHGPKPGFVTHRP